jgi:hypothetical protein
MSAVNVKNMSPKERADRYAQINAIAAQIDPNFPHTIGEAAQALIKSA